MLKKLGVLLVVSLAITAHAKDLGVQGAVFEIREQSLLELIQGKLRALESTNKLADHQREIQQRVKRSIENPLPVEGIQTATSFTSRNYDPSILIDEDIKDHKGAIIALKGTHVNPLDHHSFGKPLLFIKGDEEAQVEWALKQEAKIILVSGKPLQLARIHRKTFFYDQGGALSKKFSIIAVPARVSQNGKSLLVEEISVSGGK